MNRTSNFLLRNGKLNFEIKCILVKCPCCPLRFLSKNCGESLGAMAGLASMHKCASGLGLVASSASQSTPRFAPLAPNPENATDIICFLFNIFSVIFYLMCSTNLTVQN